MSTSSVRPLVKYIALSALLIFSCKNEQMSETTEAEKGSDYYTEQHRPQFHFSPEANWMNDPNGMVYYDGEYIFFINTIRTVRYGARCIGRIL